MAEHKYDIVVFGASSFVGEILCNYLSKNREEPTLRWAIAGRSSAKLSSLQTLPTSRHCGRYAHKPAWSQQQSAPMRYMAKPY